MKKDKLLKNNIYHIFNKSIAGYKIFNNTTSKRFMLILQHYNEDPVNSLSNYIHGLKKIQYKNLLIPEDKQITKFISYNIMPTHYHFLLKVRNKNLIYQYMNNIGNAFSSYFNPKYNRKGPLWQSSFQSVHIKTEEQLLHVSRYIHLNPTTAGLVKKPEDWKFSSYRSYIEDPKILKNIMTEIPINDPKTYKTFCENQVDYQRQLGKIKKFILE